MTMEPDGVAVVVGSGRWPKAARKKTTAAEGPPLRGSIGSGQRLAPDRSNRDAEVAGIVAIVGAKPERRLRPSRFGRRGVY
jgi:hypothetical protein